MRKPLGAATGFARANESVFPVRTVVAPGPGGLRRRRPQHPGEAGGFRKGGLPPSCLSPAVAAASAVTGVITHPREVVREPVGT